MNAKFFRYYGSLIHQRVQSLDDIRNRMYYTAKRANGQYLTIGQKISTILSAFRTEYGALLGYPGGNATKRSGAESMT